MNNNMNKNNMDMATLMNLLAKMDKKELEKNLNTVSQILKSNDANSIIDNIKKKNM